MCICGFYFLKVLVLKANSEVSAEGVLVDVGMAAGLIVGVLNHVTVFMLYLKNSS